MCVWRPQICHLWEDWQIEAPVTGLSLNFVFTRSLILDPKKNARVLFLLDPNVAEEIWL